MSMFGEASLPMFRSFGNVRKGRRRELPALCTLQAHSSQWKLLRVVRGQTLRRNMACVFGIDPPPFRSQAPAPTARSIRDPSTGPLGIDLLPGQEHQAVGHLLHPVPGGLPAPFCVSPWSEPARSLAKWVASSSSRVGSLPQKEEQNPG